ncbi:MAG: molybdopterin-binding protein [Sulfurimonadaceae bacterium]|jgi:molybdopterin-biosynthesis enzyme MoeA-like protein|nr:molybdopterin-binding protein [Sulfurimonadaceae bacterium]
MNFYALIIGTEILNGRREDKHFKFVQQELEKYSHEMFASFVIKDNRDSMIKTYNLIKQDPEAVMFSFGGIGSTPDDLTREIASEVFTGMPLMRHKKFEQDILERFGEAAYPHRIQMADLPPHSELLFNPVNNMSGFSLDNRYFFVPGFPEMAHPMIAQAIGTYFSQATQKHRFTLIADTSESFLIDVMYQIPAHIELSSLPMFRANKPMVEISLSGTVLEEIESYFNLFIQKLKKEGIDYKLM